MNSQLTDPVPANTAVALFDAALAQLNQSECPPDMGIEGGMNALRAIAAKLSPAAVWRRGQAACRECAPSEIARLFPSRDSAR